MKKSDKASIASLEKEMLPEYDFSGHRGVRGKYYERYRQGHLVRVEHDDGTVSTRYFELEDGAVLLDPDLRAHFPDSAAVNRALRGLVDPNHEAPTGSVASKA